MDHNIIEFKKKVCRLRRNGEGWVVGTFNFRVYHVEIVRIISTSILPSYKEVMGYKFEVIMDNRSISNTCHYHIDDSMCPIFLTKRDAEEHVVCHKLSSNSVLQWFEL